MEAAGEYLCSHILQLLALGAPRRFAEFLHQKIRAMWGIAELATDLRGKRVRNFLMARHRFDRTGDWIASERVLSVPEVGA